PNSKFTRPEVTGILKKFGTCNVYYNRKKGLQNAKKRQLEIEKNINYEDIDQTQENENNLELIEPTDLCSYIIEHLNIHLFQSNDDLKICFISFSMCY
ncbi:2915_t:CDS:1, partial [Cetraspora pellucida]